MGAVDAAPLVFSFLGYGFSSVGVWIGVIGFVSVLTIPYIFLTFPLYVVTGSLDRRRRWLAFVPFVNASVLARLATGSLDRTTALALLRLGLLFCLIVHVVVFAWFWSMENYGGSVLRAWIDGSFKLGAILFGEQALTWPDREGAAATSWFYAALALPFAHWLVFSAWAWVGVARATGQPSWLGWLAAIPVLGVIPQWAIALRAKDSGPLDPQPTA